MSVTSLAWLGWMIASVGIYWSAPSRFRDVVLVGTTLTFLIVYDTQSALILSIFIGTTYWSCNVGRVSNSRAVLICALLICTLAFYKLRLVTGRSDWLGATAIPLGLSYYSFRCLHYVLEKYKGTLRPHGFRDFAVYLLFLPTILAGPIHRFPAFRRDLSRCRWDSGLFAEGLERILYGYVKIMVIGVYLLSEQAAAYVEVLEIGKPVLATYLQVIRRSLYGYFLFAGYSDVAIGFARLLGLRVMENFNWPFIRKNISDFWKSWHISLSSFIREYAYTPIFAITRNAAIAAIVSMVLFGLWHEFSFRYILWGAYHGAGIAVWQQFQKLKPVGFANDNALVQRICDLLSIITTFHFVVFGFVLTFEPTVFEALKVYATIFTGWW
jgi:alginate O-acetyltransferase complex protein AlgI